MQDSLDAKLATLIADVGHLSRQLEEHCQRARERFEAVDARLSAIESQKNVMIGWAAGAGVGGAGLATALAKLI